MAWVLLSFGTTLIRMSKKPHQEETFRDMCFGMEKGTPVGDAGERGFNWGRKAKTSFRHTFYNSHDIALKRNILWC